MGKCKICGRESITISSRIGFCYDCICTHFKDIKDEILSIHANSRIPFGLPPYIPKGEGVVCDLCINRCSIKDGEYGFCGVRKNKSNHLLGGTKRGNLYFYYDPLPTNCVADWVCPGGTGSGYPKYSYKEGKEFGYYNLAVFFRACNFNCLYCQNWSYKEGFRNPNFFDVDDLVNAAFKREVSCVCFFGGDPTPQIIYAILVSKKILKRKGDRIVRICWETNGALNEKLLKQIANISLESGGCVKFDLKAWNEGIHIALCGVSNKKTVENFSWLSTLIDLRKDPPLLVASTLLVPGYVDVEEVKKISDFIASLNPDIPYTLLAFYPTFVLNDLPRTSFRHAMRCLEAAKVSGLRRVRIGNKHLLSQEYD